LGIRPGFPVRLVFFVGRVPHRSAEDIEHVGARITAVAVEAVDPRGV
jgi:hypothetical protein